MRRAPMLLWTAITSTALACLAPAQQLRSTLTGLRLDGREVPFGGRVTAVVRTIARHRHDSWLPDGCARVRVLALDGVELHEPTLVWARVPKAVTDALDVGTALRLTASLQDCGDRDGATSVALSVLRHEHAHDAPELPVPPDLDAAIDTEVELLGTFWSHDTDQYVDVAGTVVLPLDEHGRRRRIDAAWHGARVRVRGLLRRQLRWPPGGGDDAALEPTFVVFAAAVDRVAPQPSDGAPDRRFSSLAQLYDRTPTRTNGAFVLLPEFPHARNWLGNESRARSFVDRNRPWLRHDVDRATPAMRDEFAARLAAPTTDPTLRRIYAGMLAAHDDARGRTFLLDCLADLAEPDTEPDVDAIYVLAEFPAWRQNAACDAAWTEAPLVRCLREVPQPTIVRTSTCERLATLRSRRGAEVMLELLERDGPALAADPFASFLVSPRRDLCLALARLPADIAEVSLLQRALDAADEAGESPLLRALLERDARSVLDRYLPRLAEARIASQFRTSIRAGNLAELERRLPTLPDDARREADYLLLRRAPDAAGRLAARLASDDTAIDELWRTCWELRDLDPGRARAVAADAARALRQRVLRHPRADELVSSHQVASLIRFVGASSDRGAILEMVELLDARFAPVATPGATPIGLKSLIADQLADMTGVSLGLDAERWRAWLRDN